MVRVELSIFCSQDRIAHIYWNLSDGKNLPILGTDTADLITIGILNDRCLAVDVGVGIGN
jgi:hypothetical protein